MRNSHGHKNTISELKFNRNGNWLLAGSRDQLVKVYDLRTMKELGNYRGHKKEINCRINLTVLIIIHILISIMLASHS
jgi:WD40 repeat protein